MSLLTVNEIALICGLSTPDEFQKQNTDPHRTGKTTKMLLEAVKASQVGKVSIQGYSKSYTFDLQTQAQDLCNQVGLDPSNIIRGYKKEVGHKDYDFYFEDHYRSIVKARTVYCSLHSA